MPGLDAGLVDIGLDDLKAFVPREALQFQKVIPVFCPCGDGATAQAVPAKVPLKVDVTASFADDVRDRPIRQGVRSGPGRGDPDGSHSRPVAPCGADAAKATVRRFHYDSHEQLRTRLNDFIATYNFGRRLKTLKGLTPYEYICRI